jgi:hypothetical protein
MYILNVLPFIQCSAYTQATIDSVCAGATLFMFTPLEGQMVLDKKVGFNTGETFHTF